MLLGKIYKRMLHRVLQFLFCYTAADRQTTVTSHAERTKSLSVTACGVTWQHRQVVHAL